MIPVASGTHASTGMLVARMALSIPGARRARALAVAGAALVTVAAPSTQGAPPAPALEVLGNFSTSAGFIALGFERCHPQAKSDDEAMYGCPIRLQLRSSTDALDSVVLGDHPACSAPSAVMMVRHLAQGFAVPTWASEANWCHVELAVQVVQLAPDQSGLLISEETGVEYPRTCHTLIVGRGDKLSVVWRLGDPLSCSAQVRVVPSKKGDGEDVIAADVYAEDGADRDQLVTRILARRMHWDAAANGLVESPLPEPDVPMQLVYIGPFPSLEAARAVSRRPVEDCHVDRQIIPAALLPGLGFQGYLIGDVYEDRAKAEKALDAGKCPVGLRPKILEYVPKHTVAPFERRAFKERE